MKAAGQRNGVIDFWRGFILVVIFINHIPGNLVEHVTPRNFGFSDAAEAFIFISGLALALVYYPRIPQGDVLGVARRCLKRSFQLYKVHLVLTCVAIALFSVGYEISDDIGLIEADGRAMVFGDTAKGVTGILLLGHQLGYFNILPLYIALMLWAPVAMVLMRVNRWLGLAVSVGIYVLARHDVIALPSWPEPGKWFFNPFAWQLLFTLGLLAGTMFARGQVPFHRMLVSVSLGILLSALVIATDGFSLLPGLMQRAMEGLDLNKTDLGLGRLIHFLALAYVVTQVRITQALPTSVMGPELQRLGRHSLPIFAVGSVLSAVGQIVMTLTAVKSSASPQVIGMVFTILGIVTLIALARYLEWTKQSSADPRRERAKPLGLSPVSQEPRAS